MILKYFLIENIFEIWFYKVIIIVVIFRLKFFIYGLVLNGIFLIFICKLEYLNFRWMNFIVLSYVF